jgi:hypothetical protein
MKLHLRFAGIALLLVVAPATAAETETERLKRFCTGAETGICDSSGTTVR